MHRAPDSEIVARAKAEGRTVVTADLDFPRPLALARATEPSLILFRGGNWSDVDVVQRMSDVLAAVSAADIAQSILVVDRNSVRRRRLPVGK
jgi:predicted nuclease of predicted toxin-antitoxin system